MSQNIGQTELQTKTRRLLDGPLKHIRVVALAAALMPLASVAAAPAPVQCGSSVCPPPPPANQPGTGTPGYWKTHASAWPPGDIIVGGVTYTTVAQAITWLGRSGSDKTITMFSSLLSAKLNLKIGNDGSCVDAAIAEADTWLIANPVGSNVAGSSAQWAIGEPIHIRLDTYNNGLLYNINGLLCAPHRQ